MRTLVSLDIETTGLDAERDAILEIGIVKFRGEDIIEEWSSLINPNRPIPAKIVELTGISQQMADQDGIDLWDGLRKTVQIAGTSTIVGHNIGFDLSFFKKQRQLERNASIDTFELASILVPHAGRYSLGALAGELGITLPATHRALDDARVTHQLYLRAFERAAALPKEVLDEISQHADRSGWALGDFWRDALEEQSKGAFTTSIGAALKRKLGGTSVSAQAALSKKMARAAQLDARPLKPKDPITPMDVEKTAALLSNNGPFAAKFDHYEPRPQQIDMLRRVVKAFNEDNVALIEAGTGTGKSLAYLVPSMLWAIQNGQRVVVSTNTINLQEQLAEKDVPAVIEILGGEGRAAVMKGKGRYVCPLRVKDMRRAGPKTLDEVRILTKILIWLPNTLTGDADELFMPAPGERAAFQHLSAQNPGCNLNTCTATDCYFHQARRLAESAHIVIVNHALLLADIAVENRALPEYRRLVIDEGHHLESAATDSLTYRLERDEIGRTMGELGRSSSAGRARPTGLLPDIASRARTALSVDRSAAIEAMTTQGMKAVADTWVRVTELFDLMADVFEDEASEAGDYSQRIRLTKAVRNRAGWGQVELSADNLAREMNGLARELNKLFQALNEQTEMASSVPDYDTLLAKLNGAIRFATDASEQVNKMLVKPHDESIYWIEIENRRGGRSSVPRLSLSVAPLRVGPMMDKFIWQAKDSVVLTSATIQTASPGTRGAPSFNYIRERLGALDADTFAVGSPFDYKKSTLVYLVTDIPEPNQPGYQQFVERGLIALFRASQGRGLALFTNYSSLRQTSRVISPELLKDEIMVYEQGDGSSRRVMVEQFRAADRAVMLGTRSFWEGVDIQGDKLSALAICKLPFDVPTDPVFSARSETFDNAFNDFSVPETVLKFRQGFGRLIRSRSDRGVVLILDKRVTSKNYGASFLGALPDPTIQRGPLVGIEKAARDWLAATPQPPART